MKGKKKSQTGERRGNGVRPPRPRVGEFSLFSQCAPVNVPQCTRSSLKPTDESYLQNLFAARIGGKEYGKSTAIYKFEKIKRAKRAALAAHPGAEIIDLGVGEPDEMAFPQVVAQLAQEAAKPENRGYSDNGDDVLKVAAARYLEKVCGVPGIDPETEVIHSIGSKAALTILPAA
jgi:LL-diaminopimelate aminotransferase